MNGNYQKAVTYARHCGLERDLVHDLFVEYWNKTKKNIFLEKENYVMKAMRNRVLNLHRSKKYMKNGKLVQRVIVELPDDMVEPPNQYNYTQLSQLRQGALSLKGTHRTVYTWLERGFMPAEIGEIEGMSSSLVSWYRLDIAKRLN